MPSSAARISPLTTTSTFGELLKHLRKRSDMTQADLAAAAGYSVPFISNLELNQRLPDVQAVAQRIVPALALQEEPQLAARLVELALVARGKDPARAKLSGDMRRWLLPAQEAPAPTLPLSPTELLGRRDAVKTICNRLLGHVGRLLTLTGPPGIGKTRLALAVAEQMQAFYRDGAYFISLAAIHNPDLMIPALSAGLGLNTADERMPKARLLDFLRRKEMLLLLDNFEQIIAAAPLLAEVLSACPNLHVMVTSRERLHLRAEQRYRVPPLDMEAAVTLFAQRAQAVAEDFAPDDANQPILMEICRKLDGLPLAIELVAARVDLFTPQALLARLRDRQLDVLSDGPSDLPPHQRTLRNAIHRSYALLNNQEQHLFRALGVFVGGFDADTLAAVDGDEATLHALMNKSLVQVIEGKTQAHRFLLLETLREFAREQLVAAGEAVAIQQRHAAHYVRLAEAAAQHLRGPEQARWLDRLTEEHANLRAALAFSLSGEATEIAVRLGIALWRFCYVRGHYAEGWQWLEQALAHATTPEQRAQLHYGSGMLARRRGDMAAAIDHLAASLTLFRELKDARGVASALRGMGFVHYVQNDLAAARPLLEEALGLFRALDDLEGVAVTLDSLGYIAQGSADASHLFAESLALRRQSGNLRGITMSLAGLAGSAIQQGDFAAARHSIQEHLQINQALGNQNGIATAINLLGIAEAAEGNFAEARLCFEQCVKLCRESDDRLFLPSAIQRLAFCMILCGEMEGAVPLLEEALARALEQGKIVTVGEVFADFARLAINQGLAERALTLLGAAEAKCKFLSPMLYPRQQSELARTKAAAHAMLTPDAAASAWAAGQAMTLEQAVAFALTRIR